MMLYLILLSLMPLLAQAANQVHTGFNYGAFWADGANVKKIEDFRDGFNYAKNLSTIVSFDSARLFTCKTHGTKDEPTGAFEAAVQTKTKLLLGFWITPDKRGGPLDEVIKNEMSALGKGFQKHGQALADLIIGLSVGSEDIFRWEATKESGVAASEVSATIKKVKDAILTSSFATYMKEKPVGHVDTAQFAVVDGADFYGITAYPYWQNETVAKAKESFLGSLENVKQRAGNVPVWIAETGWPFEGAQRGDAVASMENQQTFWKEVGCSIVGLYPTFWFELIKDSTPDQPDWAVIDSVTHQPRIKDFGCEAGSGPKFSAPAPALSSGQLPAASSPLSQPVLSSFVAPSSSHAGYQNTTHVTTTIIVTITVPPTPSLTSPLPSNKDPVSKSTTMIVTVTSSTASVQAGRPAKRSPATILPDNIPWCVTVADIAWNGQYVPIAGNPAGPDGKCAPAPTYTGLPYGIGGTAPASRAVARSVSGSSNGTTTAILSVAIPTLAISPAAVSSLGKQASSMLTLSSTVTGV